MWNNQHINISNHIAYICVIDTPRYTTSIHPYGIYHYSYAYNDIFRCAIICVYKTGLVYRNSGEPTNPSLSRLPIIYQKNTTDRDHISTHLPGTPSYQIPLYHIGATLVLLRPPIEIIPYCMDSNT